MKTTPQTARMHFAPWLPGTPARVVATLMLVVVLSVSVSSFIEGRLARSVIELPLQLQDLKKHLGYGGLIHNFKNYVIRPSEDQYRLDAQNSGRLALDKLDEIAIHLNMARDDVVIAEGRRVIARYVDATDTVSMLHADGKTPQEIDAAVRISDVQAIAMLRALEALVDDTVQNKLLLLRLATALLFGLTLTSMAALLSLANAERGLALERAKKAEDVAQSERKASRSAEQARCKAVAANEELQSFAYAMSHDMKGPANTLTLLLTEMRASDAGTLTDDQQNILSMSLATLDRMNNTTSDLLAYAGVVSGSPVEERVELSDLLQEIRRDLYSELSATGGQILIAKDLPAIHAGRTELRSLFQNLISNGLKYRKNDTSPIVEVRSFADRSSGEVILCVDDNGIGIDSEDYDKIFAMFKRLHRYSEVAGTGLGLTLCRRVAMGLGGTIEVEPRLGGGSRFSVRIPEEKRVA